ncbi:hypothetical protein [Streptomyces purpureus]|uniref:Uncharacterized protein n=1 Tax=Streptomyces purpureus TaxID=1951 RepID=A0A918HFA3_9ACTN|nr:hypothetical protein [Streptomyces purpureus]GGT56687.1 hypothetical protein GCM10014713_58000 [Streptomyces purpureus]
MFLASGALVVRIPAPAALGLPAVAVTALAVAHRRIAARASLVAEHV